MDDQVFFINDDREPPDKINVDKLHQLNIKKGKKNKTQTDTKQDCTIHQNDDYFDKYGAPDFENEYDADAQSLDEGIEIGEEISTKHHHQLGPMLHSSNVEEVREVAGKQGLSPRERKNSGQNKNTSTSKPNTRGRSRGL